MDADSLERRAVQRSRVFLGGEVLIGRDFHPIECLIKNISECGAYLDVANDRLLPNEFDLVVRKSRMRHRAIVAWRIGARVGLVFQISARTRNETLH